MHTYIILTLLSCAHQWSERYFKEKIRLGKVFFTATIFHDMTPLILPLAYSTRSIPWYETSNSDSPDHLLVQDLLLVLNARPCYECAVY